jgi:hypothetical protein
MLNEAERIVFRSSRVFFFSSSAASSQSRCALTPCVRRPRGCEWLPFCGPRNESMPLLCITGSTFGPHTPSCPRHDPHYQPHTHVETQLAMHAAHIQRAIGVDTIDQELAHFGRVASRRSAIFSTANLNLTNVLTAPTVPLLPSATCNPTAASPPRAPLDLDLELDLDDL